MNRFFLCLLLTGVTVPAAADEMYGPDYQGCSRNSTADIVDCIGARTRSWEATLNAEYDAAMARSHVAQREALHAAQQRWIEYRDANCRFYALREGSIRQIEAAECLHSMTEARARELRRMAQN
jgi:uncharacterized protein YecT (DUF1311 family)